MLRKLLTSLVCAGILASHSANALDLGAMHIYSVADEPLDAEITLLEVEDFTAEHIKPRFAGVDDLALSGLDAKRYLRDVQLQVVINKGGESSIRLSSPRPINTSFISFLLEVNWPNGRLLREYTALLKGTPAPSPKPVETVSPARKQPQPTVDIARDAPPVRSIPQAEVIRLKPAGEGVATTSAVSKADVGLPSGMRLTPAAVTPEEQPAAPKPAVSSVTSQQIPPQIIDHSRPFLPDPKVSERDADVTPSIKPAIVKPVAVASVVEIPGSQAQAQAQASEYASVEIEQQDAAARRIKVGAKETLWDLTQRHRISGAYTNQQMMLALYTKNPEAFVNGSINGLKGGTTLLLPTEQEVASVSAHDALVKIRKALKAPAQPGVKAVAKVDTVVVGPNQTLWDLVISNRASDAVNPRQLMLALVKKNPHAFEGGNINRMRKGVTLKMPSLAEYNALSAAQAYNEVARQISRKASTGGSQVDKPENTVARTTGEASAQTPQAPKVVRIGARETLWSIAINNLPDSSVRAGVMIKAIMAKNPHAFANNDMNQMRVGELLKMPTMQDIQRIKAQ